MKKSIRLASIALCLVLAGSSSASAQTNGGFEEGTDPGAFLPVSPGQDTITGWSVDTGTVDYIGTYWQASNFSLRSIDMNGSSAGQISQTLITQPGATYDVTFDLSGNPGGVQYKLLSVSIDGGSTQFYEYITGFNTPDNMGWVPRTYSFIATGTTTVLSFKSEIDGFDGPALDNVQVFEVLPPPTPTPTPSPSPSPTPTPSPSPSPSPTPTPPPPLPIPGQICHRNNGRNGGNTLIVGLPAVPAHLRHGDYLGPCVP